MSGEFNVDIFFADYTEESNPLLIEFVEENIEKEEAKEEDESGWCWKEMEDTDIW